MSAISIKTRKKRFTAEQASAHLSGWPHVATSQDLDAATSKHDFTPLNPGDPTSSPDMGFIYRGIPFAVENAKGSTRSGVDKGGHAWSTTMAAHYGYALGTDASTKDGDDVDFFFGPDLATSDTAYVVNQMKHDDPKSFDEHKVMLGYKNADSAEAGYLANYSKDWTGFGSIADLPLVDLVGWLATADLSQPLAGQRTKDSTMANKTNQIGSLIEQIATKVPGTDTSSNEPTGEEEAMAADDLVAIKAITDDVNTYVAHMDYILGRRRTDDPDAPGAGKGGKGWQLTSPEKIHAALGYYNAGAGKEQEGSHWETLGHSIAAAATKQYGKPYRVVNGAVKAVADGTASLRCPVCNSGDSWDTDAQTCKACGTDEKPIALVRDAIDAYDVKGGPGQLISKEWLDKYVGKISELNDAAEGSFPNMGVSAAVGSPTDLPPVVALGIATMICPWCQSIVPFNLQKFPNEVCPQCGIPLKQRAIDSTHTTDSADPIHIQKAYDSLVIECDEVKIVKLMAGDAEKGIIQREKRLATIADSVNLNKRLYPSRTLDNAIDEMQPEVKMGLRHSAMEHPELARKDDGSKEFVDDTHYRTATITKVDHVDPKTKKVYMHRVIHDTPNGRRIKAANDAGKPLGVSMRFEMDGHWAKVDGNDVLVADWIRIDTWDDVMNPAVPQTRGDYHLVTDSVIADITQSQNKRTKDNNAQSQISEEAGDSGAASNAKSQKGKNNPMKAVKSSRALNEYRVAAVSLPKGAPLTDTQKVLVATRRQAFLDTFDAESKAAEGEGEAMEGSDALLEGLLKVDEMMEAFMPGRMMPIGAGVNTNIANGVPLDVHDVPGLNETHAGESPKAPISFEAKPDMHDGDAADDMKWLQQKRKDEAAKAAADAYDKAIDDAIEANSSIDSISRLDDNERIHVLNNAKAYAKAAHADASEIPEYIQKSLDQLSPLISSLKRQATGLHAPASNGRTVDDPAGLGMFDDSGNMTGYRQVQDPMRGTGKPLAFDVHAFGLSMERPNVPIMQIGNSMPWMKGALDIINAADDAHRDKDRSFDAKSKSQQLLRMANMPIVKMILEECVKQEKRGDSLEGWFKASDAWNDTAVAKKMGDSVGDIISGHKGMDATTLSSVWNQPSIWAAFLIQQFWDLQFLQFVHSWGPGSVVNYGQQQGGWDFQTPLSGGQQAFGSTFRIPVEIPVQPGLNTYGATVGTWYSEGLLVPEGQGIPLESLNIRWLEFGAAWRRLAVTATRDMINAFGHGPANTSAVGRLIYHMAFAKSRYIDPALANEMTNVADEYQCAPIINESTNLANNSAYSTGPSLTVNLNPLKAADTAPVANLDSFMVYGSNSYGQVVAAVRLQDGLNGLGTDVGNTAGILCGGTFQSRGVSFNATIPVTRPRTSQVQSTLGQETFVTTNPVTVSVNGVAQVVGAFDNVNNAVITTMAQTNAGQAATCAVDWENGVVIFLASANVGGSGSGTGHVITTPITVSYSYATNMDHFVVQYNGYQNTFNPSNAALETYYNGLVVQFDSTTVDLNVSPNYSKANLGLLPLKLSNYMTQATIFYKLNSPDGTSLWPAENMFAERNGLMVARHNTPWNVGNNRIWVGVNGSTKYAIETALQIRGPLPAYTAAQAVIDAETYYLGENSAIFTPLPQDNSVSPPTILNPASRTIKCHYVGQNQAASIIG